MSNFYPVMEPLREVRGGAHNGQVTVGNVQIGNFTVSEGGLRVETEGYVYPPEEAGHLAAVAEQVGCVATVGESRQVNLGGDLGVVDAAPVTLKTDRTALNDMEVMGNNRGVLLAGHHARRVIRFGRALGGQVIPFESVRPRQPEPIEAAPVARRTGDGF